MSRNFYGVITEYKRWNLDLAFWERPENDAQMRKSWGIVKFPVINETEDYKLNVIILIDGSRIEDHCKKGMKLNPKESGVSKIRKYFLKNKVDDVEIHTIYMDKDAPINEESILLAEYVERLTKLNHIKTISVMGHSKGATLIFNAVKYIKEEKAFKKLNLYTVSTPFLGTIFASPKIMYPKIRKIFKIKPLSSLVIRIYESISSNSHMDYDIGVADGVYEMMKHLYDKTFIENMLRDENINAVKKVNSYTNIVTKVDERTLHYIFAELNVPALGMYIFKKLVFGKEPADGFVPVKSQLALDDKTQGELYSIILPGSQHHFLSSTRLTNQVCMMIKNNL